MALETHIDGQSNTPAHAGDAHTAKLYDDAYDASKKSTAAPSKSDESLLGRVYDYAAGAVDIGAQVVAGAATKAYEAVTEHPLDTAITLAEGAAVGVAIVAAAPALAAIGASAAVVAGVGLAADLAIVGLAATGAVAAAKDSITAASESASSADVLLHSAQHSQAEVDAARADIRAKTGSAALEVAGAAAVTFGSVGAAAKVGASVKSGLKIITESEPGLSSLPKLSLVEHEKPTIAMEHQSAPQSAMESRKPTDSVVTGKEKSLESGELPKIPSDAAILRLSDRLTNFIGDRNSEVSLSGLMRRTENLAMKRTTKMDVASASKNFGETMLSNFDDVAAMRKQLKNSPEASAKYEQYLNDQAELRTSRAQQDRELQLRREGYAKIFNEETKFLFPGEVVPKIQVSPLVSDSNVLAAYGEGKIKLRDNDLARGGPLDRIQDGDRLTDKVLHEGKHAEQDGLMLRKYIDTVTGGDTSGRSLTPQEVQRVAQQMWNKTNPDLEAVVRDVNQQRAGRPLTQKELARADGLVESRRLLRESDHRGERVRKDELADLYSDIFPADKKAGITSAQSLLENDYYSQIFRADNPKVAALKAEFDKLPKFDGVITEFNAQFEKKARPVLKEALWNELQTARSNAKENFDLYRKWMHEREAWAVGDAAEGLLGPLMEPAFSEAELLARLIFLSK